MSRKRFVKLAMSQGCSKREALFAAEYCRLRWGNYRTAWNELHGQILGRFHTYVGKLDLKAIFNTGNKQYNQQ